MEGSDLLQADLWDSSHETSAHLPYEQRHYYPLPRFDPFVPQFGTDKDIPNRVHVNQNYGWMTNSGFPSGQSGYVERTEWTESFADFVSPSRRDYSATSRTSVLRPLRSVHRHPYSSNVNQHTGGAFFSPGRDRFPDRANSWSSVFSSWIPEYENEDAPFWEAYGAPFILNPSTLLSSNRHQHHSQEPCDNHLEIQDSYEDNYILEALPTSDSPELTFPYEGSPSSPQPDVIPDFHPLASTPSSPMPSSRQQAPRGRLRHQWRLLEWEIESLRRQRQELSQDHRVLHRSKQALELAWQSFRSSRECDLRRRERQRRWGYYRYDFGRDFDGEPEKQHGHGNRARDLRATSDYPCVADTDDDFLTEESRSHYSAQGSDHGDGRQHKMLSGLTPEAIADAKTHLERYKLAWSPLSTPATPITSSMPYPTPTLQLLPLLSPFPGHLSLPYYPKRNSHFPKRYHPPLHIRIQYHTLEFYLNTFGVQALLEFDYDESIEDFKSRDKVANFAEVGREALANLKTMMDREVMNWHEDRLRARGFSAALVSNDNVLEQMSAPFIEEGNETRIINSWDVYQGVWAAILLLRDWVKDELERRKRKDG